MHSITALQARKNNENYFGYLKLYHDVVAIEEKVWHSSFQIMEVRHSTCNVQGKLKCLCGIHDDVCALVEHVVQGAEGHILGNDN